MARLVLSDGADEKSSYTIVATITDEDDAALTPSSITWSLRDRWGNTINARSAVSIASPASANNITLSDDDLALDVVSDPKRILTLEAVYNSSYGSGLPLKAEVEFQVSDLIGIT